VALQVVRKQPPLTGHACLRQDTFLDALLRCTAVAEGCAAPRAELKQSAANSGIKRHALVRPG